MARVVFESEDKSAGQWIAALISLSKAERGCTLGEFCQRCGITYRFLYQVVDGRSAISAESLASLKSMAASTGAVFPIESKLLAQQLGLSDRGAVTEQGRLGE